MKKVCLFIGGENNGRRVEVDVSMIVYNMPTKTGYEQFKRERFLAGRDEFFIYVETSLGIDQAFRMLISGFNSDSFADVPMLKHFVNRDASLYLLQGFDVFDRWAYHHDATWKVISDACSKAGFNFEDRLKMLAAGLLKEKHGML